jgi:hypothetical protein
MLNESVELVFPCALGRTEDYGHSVFVPSKANGADQECDVCSGGSFVCHVGCKEGGQLGVIVKRVRALGQRHVCLLSGRQRERPFGETGCPRMCGSSGGVG